jgi:hypothetical protein
VRQGKCSYDFKHEGGYEWEYRPTGAPAPVKPPKEADDPDDTDGKPLETVEDGFYGELKDVAQETLARSKELLEKIGTYRKHEQMTAPNKPDLPKTEPGERLIFGVTEREIVCFQGLTNPLKIMKYRQIAAGQKISFNVFAGLFSPYYIFYSRMRAAGVLVSLITFIFSLPNTLLMFYDVPGVSAAFTADGLLQTGAVLGYLSFALRILVGLFFDYFHLRWTAYRIRLFRVGYLRATVEELTPDMTFKLSDLGEEYYRFLQDSGKPGMLYMFLDSIVVNLALAAVFYMLFIV